MSGYIHDQEYDEYYVPDEDQCLLCTDEAVKDGLCLECWEDEENKP